MNLASCLISFFVLCIASFGTCCAQGNYSHPSIEKLNLTFRTLYATARQQRLDETGPIVIVQGAVEAYPKNKDLMARWEE